LYSIRPSTTAVSSRTPSREYSFFTSPIDGHDPA
jgi:hypothetical protein